MAPLNIPHHWKQTEETLENVLNSDDDQEQEIQLFEDEDISESEGWIGFDDDTSSLNVSDIEDVIAYVLGEASSESAGDSIDFHLLSEDDDARESTPVLPHVPDARRRLFDNSSGEDDDDDGVAYLRD